MDQRKKYLNEYYENYDEDGRLLSKHGEIEFITTTSYIEKYLKPNSKILEVGAGTGRYSLYYADKGYDVTAVDFVKHNVDVIKSKIKDNMNINALQGDALDLSNFKDNTFDITLVLGPLYHLYTDEDVNKAIKEAIRVTKKGGIIAYAYLANDAIIISYGLQKDHLVEEVVWDENFRVVSKQEELFRAFYISEFKDMLKKYNVKYLHNIATDGLSHHLKEKIDSLSDEEFNVWVKYHLSTCEREELQGYSSHMLYICEKE